MGEIIKLGRACSCVLFNLLSTSANSHVCLCRCLRPGLLYRAALEGATFSLYAGMQRMKEHGAVATELRIVGGGSNNPVWRQIVAGGPSHPHPPTLSSFCPVGG